MNKHECNSVMNKHESTAAMTTRTSVTCASSSFLLAALAFSSMKEPSHQQNNTFYSSHRNFNSNRNVHVMWLPFYKKNGRLAFLSPPPLEGLGATDDNHLRLIGKRIPISINRTFSLGVTAEALRANIGSKSAISLQWGLVDPKFQAEGATPHQPFFLSEN